MKSFRLVRGLGVAVAVGAVMSGVSQSGAEVEKSATGLDSVGIPLGVDAANRSVQDGLIDWKITYEQPLDEPGTVTLRDAVTGAQSYQPGSLKVPTDWTPGEVANPDGTTTLTATNPLVAPGGRGSPTCCSERDDEGSSASLEFSRLRLSARGDARARDDPVAATSARLIATSFGPTSAVGGSRRSLARPWAAGCRS